MAKTLPGGLKMWVPALDGEGGLGRTPKEFGDMKISVRKRLDQTKNRRREADLILLYLNLKGH